MGLRSLEATKVRFSFSARTAETFARDLPLVEADFFLPADLPEDLALVDFFFFFVEELVELLLDLFDAVCATAGATMPGASNAQIRRYVRKWLGKLTARSV